MGIGDSTMALSTTLFVMALLLSGATSMKSQAYFGENGELPCHFTNSQNISLDELVVFWQTQDKLVLYELFRGKENPKNVHLKYKGRTSLDQDNWILRLHNVQIKDKGLYQCFIHRKGAQGMIPIHQMNIDLSVRANFSQPEIMLISNETENSDIINVTCSSAHGYPAAKEIFLLIKSMNSTTKYDAAMNMFQNNITELYNVSTSLPIAVSPKTNTSIFCVLQPEPPQEQLFSRPFNIDPKPPKPRPPGLDTATLIAVVLTVCIAIGASGVIIWILTRKKKKPGPSLECEAIQMKVAVNRPRKE